MSAPNFTVYCRVAGVAAFGASMATGSPAQNYPIRPVRMLVGYTAGSGADVTARMIAQKLSDHLVQPVIVENRPGASGSLADG
jgi:tripartite-type tricarboxylate transporter receptor subunit TctC